jgi:hypothetical protein
MPLPPRDTAWPPAQLDEIRPALRQWSAWYGGDPTQLDAAYSVDTTVRNRPSQYRGGLVGLVARGFWGAPRADLTVPAKAKLHVPIAADLCQASADLLFAEPPTFTADDEATTARLTELIGDGMLSTFAEAAELAAALGGAYLRATWDDKIRPDGRSAPPSTRIRRGRSSGGGT